MTEQPSLSLTQQIILLCSKYPPQERLDAVNRAAKIMKGINRARINNLVKGLKVDERPDENLMKQP